MLRYIIKYCPSQLFVTVLAAVLSSTLTIINILCMRYLVNFIAGSAYIYSITSLIVFFFFCNVFVALINLLFQQFLTPINTQKLYKGMQIEIFKKTLELDLLNYENPHFFDKYSMALQQSNTRALSVLNSLSSIISSFMSIGALTALLATIEPIIFLIIGINVFISFFINIFYAKNQHEFFEEKVQFQRESAYVQRVFYLQDFTQELHIHQGLPAILNSIFSNSIAKLILLTKSYGKRNYKLLGANAVVNTSANTFSFFYLAYIAIIGEIGIGDFTAATTSSQQLASQILQLLSIFPQLYEHSMYIDNFREFMNLKSEFIDGQVKMSYKPKTGLAIDLKNVSFKYNFDQKEVLHNINLHIGAGQKIAIVGQNGAGKSTLIKLLAGLYKPSGGSMLVENYEGQLYNTDSFKQNVSVMFQDFQIFSFSIAENILMRPIKSQKDNEIVANALKVVGLYEKIMEFPEGIMTQVSREFSSSGQMFSGGELQKIAIARTFAQGAGIIIMDEPTSRLDPFSERKLLSQLLTALTDQTLILISHRLNNITNFDKIIYLDHGEIVESGSHRELMEYNGGYAKMFKLQAQKFILDN